MFGALGGGGGVFFLSAGAGTGKTFTLNLLVNDLRASGLSVRAMASSGIASQLLPQPARTVHSSCCVPRNVENMDTPRLNVYDVKMRHHWDALWETDVFVGDEACMSHGKVYAALDNTLREIAAAKVPRYGSDGTLARARVHPADMPFGGKVVVLAGHWAQTLPVVPRGARAHVTAACLFRQPFWAHVQVHRLEENFRLRGDGRVAAYASLLDDIGYGRDMVETAALGNLPPGGGCVDLPGGWVGGLMVMPFGSTTDSLCAWVYSGCDGQISGMHQLAASNERGSLEGCLSAEYFQWWRSRAILAPHRVTVRAVNDVMALKFPGLRTAMAEDTIDDADEEGCDPGSGYSPDQLASRTPSGCPPHTLQLAVGMPIMATANMPGLGVCHCSLLLATVAHFSLLLHTTAAYCCFLLCWAPPGVYNGTRLIITSMVEHPTSGGICILGCGFCDEDGQVRYVDIHRRVDPTNDAEMSFLWTRRQFPIMPCFGMTIKCASLPLLLLTAAAHCPRSSGSVCVCV